MSALEDAFTSTFMDLHALSYSQVEISLLQDLTRRVDVAVGRLCEALAQPDDEDLRDLADRAHRAVLALADALEPADSDDRRTREKLDLARAAIHALRDELDALVGRVDGQVS